MTVLVIGRDKIKLQAQASVISKILKKLTIKKQILSNSEPELPFQPESSPDILVLLLDQNNSCILTQLTSLPSHSRPALLIITDKNDSKLMRLSMQAGARDFFTEPVDADELARSLHQIIAESKKSDMTKGVLTTLINAKGGSGCSFLTCNLAHISAVNSNTNVLLLDMDLQFGTQSLLLDLEPKYSLVQALNDVDHMDSDAIDGYMVKHNSGLRVLNTFHEQLILPGELSPDNINKFLILALKTYSRVFIDIPRQIDPITASILEKSDQIVLVLQQSLSHLRDAKRLVRIMKTELNILNKNITIVVNRYSPQSSLQIKDIRDSLNCSKIVTIPNDYGRVAASMNLGVPLLDYAKNVPITKSMLDLAEELNVNIKDENKQRNFLKRFFLT